MTRRSRWAEFFEGDGNRLSMTRLLAFMAWFPASIILIWKPDDTNFSWYVSAFVIQLIGGKTADAYMRKVKGNADCPPQPDSQP